MDEHLRKLTEMAVSAGEKRVSLQTGFLHLKYHAEHEETHHTIPLVENFLFILALFRTKTIENITRAKSLMEKLLHFQSENGNFPVYLHEYPATSDNYLSVKIYYSLYWIFQGFQQILGNDLRQKAQDALIKLANHSLQLLENKNPPSHIRFQIASQALSMGKLFNIKDFESVGEKLLNEFTTCTKDWYEPRVLSELITALQLPLVQNPLFWDHLHLNWNVNLNAYCGPSVLEYQTGLEPEVTLYDLFMGCFSGNYSKRALKDSSLHLHAALVQPLVTPIVRPINLSRSGKLENSVYSVVVNQHYSYAFIEQQAVLNKAKDKGFSPFKLMWGSLDRLHTLITEGGNSKKITLTANSNTLEFLFTLSDVPELEDKEKSREISFYFDLFEKSSVKIEGFSATTFKLHEKVEVIVDGLKFSLKFEIAKGTGQFLGHFMRGNRPSQIANNGKERFAAYDWQLFLRTIRRPQDSECVIKVTLEL
jgi:hypothetical protein